MNKEEYVVATDETAIYPEAGTGSVGEIMYLTLGLIGELGELKKEAAPHEIRAEAGDCYWYLMRLLSIFQDCAFVVGNSEAITIYEWARTTSNVHAMDLSARLANSIKKIWRDGINEKAGLKVWLMLKDIEFILDSIVEVKAKAAIGLVLQENLDKLRSRKERNVLGGDGDNR